MAPLPKRRKLTSSTAPAPEEITFDFSAREDYLTGFHKRKQARIKQGQESAAKREREELIKARADLRAKRKEELEAHVRAVNRATGLETGLDGEQDGGMGDDDDEDDNDKTNVHRAGHAVIDREDEYVDEAKYTTVMVEAVDITKDGFGRLQDDEDEDDEHDQDGERTQDGRQAGQKDGTRQKKDVKAPRAKKKVKRQKFRYEGKVERRIARDKERSKNSKQAAVRKEKRKR